MDRQVTPPKRKREKLIIVFTFSIKREIISLFTWNFEGLCVWIFVRLRWCYTGRYAATQRCNVGTTLQPFETISQQCCNAVLRRARGCEFEWTFEFSTSRKFARLPFWLSLCCRCLDIVNFLLSAKCKTGCYFLPILNQPQGVVKQWVRGEGRNRREKIEKWLEMLQWEYCTSLAYQCHNLKYEIAKSRSFITLTNSSPNSHKWVCLPATVVVE